MCGSVEANDLQNCDVWERACVCVWVCVCVCGVR